MGCVRYFLDMAILMNPEVDRTWVFKDINILVSCFVCSFFTFYLLQYDYITDGKSSWRICSIYHCLLNFVQCLAIWHNSQKRPSVIWHSHGLPFVCDFPIKHGRGHPVFMAVRWRWLQPHTRLAWTKSQYGFSEWQDMHKLLGFRNLEANYCGKKRRVPFHHSWWGREAWLIRDWWSPMFVCETYLVEPSPCPVSCRWILSSSSLAINGDT